MAMYRISENNTQDMQRIGLQMLLFFDRFCREHGLTWYFCGGCCIGTARNGKFIPWDDDVDVFMPREDYEKLKRLWVNTEQYAIQFPSGTNITKNQFVTIHDNHTAFIKTFQKDLDINHGIALDILPLDGCPQGWKRTMQVFWTLVYSLYVIGEAPKNHGKLVWAAGIIALAAVPFASWRYQIWRFCEKKMSRHPISSCRYITELCSGPRAMRYRYPRECFGSPLRMEFEGHLLCMPSDYDTYLTIAFGDYKTLPPESQRVCHHEHEWIDTEHSYKIYRGKKYAVKSKRCLLPFKNIQKR